MLLLYIHAFNNVSCASSLSPLFPGTNELDQVDKIHDVLGTPDSSVLQKFKPYVFQSHLFIIFPKMFHSMSAPQYLLRLTLSMFFVKNKLRSITWKYIKIVCKFLLQT